MIILVNATDVQSNLRALIICSAKEGSQRYNSKIQVGSIAEQERMKGESTWVPPVNGASDLGCRVLPPITLTLLLASCHHFHWF